MRLFTRRSIFTRQTLRFHNSSFTALTELRPRLSTAATLHTRRIMSSSKREAPGKDASKSLKKSKPTPVIVKFYDPIEEAPDGFGRTLSTMLQWPDSKLEYAHDYIQVWFPLPEGSPFNWKAPVIDSETCSEFRNRPELRKSLQKAFTRILKFYGFEASYKGEEVHIYRSMQHSRPFGNWVTRSDHNHLRISRIIRSLRVLGLEQNAHAFYKALQEVNNDYPNTIGARSLMYWKRAAVRRLALEPAEDDEDTVGQPFLRELDEAIEREKEAAESAEEASKTEPTEEEKQLDIAGEGDEAEKKETRETETS